MSGLLRRIKRSRAADAGETSAEGRDAGPEGAPTAETSGADASSAKTTELPTAAADAVAGGAAAVGDGAAAHAGETPVDAGPASTVAGGAAADAAPAPEAPAAAVIEAEPGLPAGLDPAQAAVPVATGRRGRLRRRLRYLRRAREVMLRDLGGLLFEVHRSGGGDVAAHSGTIGAKVERLAGLDAEAAAIETALGLPRAQAVVFEPGIGGACDVCGELYGSAARFCSNCGSPAGAAAQVAPGPPTEPRAVPPMPKPPAPAEPAPEQAAEGTGSTPAEAPNGRPDDPTAPRLSADDPLAAKEPRT